MGTDPEIFKHREWLGLLQPVGLVVSPVALVQAQAFINRSSPIDLQARLQALVSELPVPGQEAAGVADFSVFALQILEWLPEDLVPQEKLPEEFFIALSDYGEVLQPSYGVHDPDSHEWMLLVQTVPPEQDLDSCTPQAEKGQGWKATVQEKFERLLRETQVPTGLLWNGRALRLVYAPRGESSGHITFPMQAMTEVPGRLILAALDMLLGGNRLFNVPRDRRLSKILANSRDYQAEVSEKLADQVVDALWELLRGFQAADAAVNGTLLTPLAQIGRGVGGEGQHVYGGLITTLMRLVFLLYAEDEGLMPNDSMYQRNYSVTGLYEQLREDESNYPDTMDQRYGAWAWLLSLFRLVYEGGGATPDYLPARHGQLFDPQEFQFLEGAGQVPRIPDRAIFNILDKLLMLDGERLSYRALDVEQIGSVYEGIMGYAVERSVSPAIGVNGRPKGSKVSTTVVIDVATLLAAKPNDRTKMLKDEANCEVLGSALQALKAAKTVEEIITALGRKISHRTPNLLPAGTLYLQPTEERRRSGSHYTPRQLTQPIVETTLHPILAALGEQPTAEQILNLKICDLAMGSGAFLVEACRQLADALVKAWERERNAGMKGWNDGENVSPTLALMPTSVEDSLLQARRLIAQRCLYGVDKNPFAVNLAKMSMWLVTLAKDKPFTFVDHALKCGDSLVGIRRPQFEEFMATTDLYEASLMGMMQENVQKAKFHRELITFADENSEQEQRENLEKAEADSRENRMLSDVIVTSFFASRRSDLDELNDSRLKNDVALAAFFATVEKSKRDAKKIRKELANKIQLWQAGSVERSELELIAAIPRYFEKPVTPFHWETEFPEVFNRENPGFDAIAGNPPFAGKNTLINANPEGYLPWLQEVHPESHGNADLVAHFFRRGFDLLRKGGTLGLIATNTIAQGDTRSTGLRFICNNGGMIYNATRRYKWPGLAAVVVSVVHIMKAEKEI
jgi:hypothetical protein